MTRQSPFTRERNTNGLLFIHPQDALDLGLEELSKQGRFTKRVISKPHVLSNELGTWFIEYALSF